MRLIEIPQLQRQLRPVDRDLCSFVLVHSAVMNRGVPQNWSAAVVPDSGTEQLAGLSGTMKITINDGKHFYDFDYALPER